MARHNRHPQTTNEMRQNALAEVDPDLTEHGVRVRSRRNPTNLPDEWDDMVRSDVRYNAPQTWKRHRQTQHRVRND